MQEAQDSSRSVEETTRAWPRIDQPLEHITEIKPSSGKYILPNYVRIAREYSPFTLQAERTFYLFDKK